MEEADALCSRVGIMVKGELRWVKVSRSDRDNSFCHLGADFGTELIIKQKIMEN